MTLALLAIMAALLVSSSLHKRLVYDETDNLSYGYRFLTKGPGVPPLGQRMPVLVLNALPCAATGVRHRHAEPRARARGIAVRAGSMVFALALAGLARHLGAADVRAGAAALAALWIAVFDPTLLAHGKQVTSDVAVSFFTAAAVYAWWRWREGRARASLAACALATGCAIASKFTGVLLIPILALLWTIDVVREGARHTTDRPRHRARRRHRHRLRRWPCSSLINAAYLFRGSFRLASTYAWQSEAFRQHVTWPVPIPLPRVFAEGLDYSSYLQENPDIGARLQLRPRRAQPRRPLVRVPADGPAQDAAGRVRARPCAAALRSPGPARPRPLCSPCPFLVVMRVLQPGRGPAARDPLRAAGAAVPDGSPRRAARPTSAAGRRWLVPVGLLAGRPRLDAVVLTRTSSRTSTS